MEAGLRAMVKGWRGARSQRLLFLWGLCVRGSKAEAEVPHQSVLLEPGILPPIVNILQGPCMQMEKGRGIGAGREGEKGGGGGSGAVGRLRNGEAQVDSSDPHCFVSGPAEKGLTCFPSLPPFHSSPQVTF